MVSTKKGEIPPPPDTTTKEENPPVDPATGLPTLEERKRMAANAFVINSKLTAEDISKLYDLPMGTVQGLKGSLVSQGKIPPTLKETPPPTPPPDGKSAGKTTVSNNGDARIAEMEQAIAEMRQKLDSSGRIIARPEEELNEIGDGVLDAFQRNQEMIAVPIVQKVVTNAKNIMFYDYMKSEQGFKGDFADLMNDALEFMMKSFKIKIKIEREVS